MKVIATLVAVAAVLSGQTFDVAAIKPSGPKSIRGVDGGPNSSSPLLYRFNQATLQDLITIAWELPPERIISSIPLDRDRFDLNAKLPPGTTKQDLRQMLKNLLGDRFQMRAHAESRELPAYELVVAKSGQKFKESVPGQPSPPLAGWPDLPSGGTAGTTQNTMVRGVPVARFRARETTVPGLVQRIGSSADRPVVDKTGLTGKYDFALEFTEERWRSAVGETSDASPLPGLATALQQQLGLQLVPKKLPFEVVVVDSFNRMPTEN